MIEFGQMGERIINRVEGPLNVEIVIQVKNESLLDLIDVGFGRTIAVSAVGLVYSADHLQKFLIPVQKTPHPIFGEVELLSVVIVHQIEPDLGG